MINLTFKKRKFSIRPKINFSLEGLTNLKLERNERVKSFSLLEIIVVLGIISFTLVAMMTVLVRANSIIKDNEIQDTANDILLQSFELFKSPEEIKILPLPIGGFTELGFANVTTNYSLQFESLANRNGYIQKSSQSSIGTCDNSSEFNVESLGTSNRPYPICIKIAITPLNIPSGTVVNRYKVVLTLSYILTSGVITEDYELTRYERFIQIT